MTTIYTDSTDTTVTPVADPTTLRTNGYCPRRRRWPGILAAGLVGAGVAAALVSSYYDDRSLGQRIDATVDAAGNSVAQQVDGMKAGATLAAERGAAVGERVADTLSDAGITAAVKTALAADPGLSALKIDVSTDGGIVTLRGPAPDPEARTRAGMMARAPDGVQGVDNRLVVVPQAPKG
jgi:hyperosmotically inducible periplasmic protein